METKPTATGQPLMLSFQRLVPGCEYSILLSGGNFFTGHIEQASGMEPAPRLSKYQLTVTASESQSQLVAGVGLVKGNIHGAFQSGSADDAQCEVRMDNAAWNGPVGDFVVETGRTDAPPTCVDLGCGPLKNCPPNEHFTGCYGYMGVFWCCLDPPYEEKAGAEDILRC